ncbi:MAG: N-acetyltransferase [Phycisphaerae bacterium]|nr:N-acetyltransferase [Phycisphaerae bacterium]
MPDDFQLRPARVGDVPGIAGIVNDYAEQGLMLHRAHAELYESLRDYQVVEAGDQLLGVAGLRIMWSNLAEIYGLAVVSAARGQGLGRRLVEALVDEARTLGVRRLFALTYERSFFERCGFDVVDRHATLPLKVWSECVRCPKRTACDEIAVLRVLEDVPELPAVQPSAEAGRYDLPVLSDSIKRIDASARTT